MEATTQPATANLLPEYTETKLKLASIAEILLAIASERKDSERTHTIQRLLADLAEDAFRLAVVGKYNRGKSSLMNAMLGHDWLPTGILPLTSAITTVRYGTTQRVLIQTKLEFGSKARKNGAAWVSPCRPAPFFQALSQVQLRNSERMTCGDWFAIDSACTPSCCLTCKD